MHLGAKLYVPYDPGSPGFWRDVALSSDGLYLVHGTGGNGRPSEESWDEGLEDFVGLQGGRGKPENIVLFAQRYGSIGFCGHRSPEPSLLPSALTWECKKCGPLRDRDDTK